MATGRDLVIDELIELYGQSCFYCNRELDRIDITIDHYIPKAASGTSEVDNLRPSCLRCNAWKADRLPLPDGSIPPKRAPFKEKAIPKEKKKSLLCRLCDSGRKLYENQMCRMCGSHPQPRIRPRYLKKDPHTCDHIFGWCRNCCLWTEEERMLLA